MHKKNTKKIVITGALGHIGSRLIRDISRTSTRHLILIDNLLTQRYASLFDLPSDIKYEFYQEDIRTDDLAARIKGAQAVIHLAAITDAESSHGKEKEVEAVNLEGLKRVADACLACHVPLLFPSTTSVYGSQASVVDETCTDLQAQSPYAESKIQAEKYLLSLKSKGLKFIICRFGTIFGWSIGMRFHTAVNKFFWQAVNGLPLTVWQTAWEQKRPYLDLSDCVSAINFILEENIFDGEIYNVLTKNFTVRQIVENIKRLLPNLTVNYVSSPIMNQLSYDVRDTKFQQLGFTPSGDLHTALTETLAHFNSVKNN